MRIHGTVDFKQALQCSSRFLRPILTYVRFSPVTFSRIRSLKNVGNFSAIIHARAFSYRPWTLTTSSPAWGGPWGAGAPPPNFVCFVLLEMRKVIREKSIKNVHYRQTNVCTQVPANSTRRGHPTNFSERIRTHPSKRVCQAGL